MNREEFDAKVREMRCQKGASIKNIELMQNEVKEELAGLKRQMSVLHKQLHKLDQHRSMLGQRRIEVEKEWAERIQKFINDNQNVASGQLAEVSEWALINELIARGFRGTIDHATRERDFVERLNARFEKGDDEPGTV